MLELEVVRASELPDAVRAELIALLDRAYDEPIAPYIANLELESHVIGREDGVMVAHATWVTRYLQAGNGPLMRTAYVELVATHPDYQHRGYASAVMELLIRTITGYEFAALCPTEAGRKLYAVLGWQDWRGPLFIRGPDSLIPTPNESVMVYQLPATSEVDLDGPLSAEWRPGELW